MPSGIGSFYYVLIVINSGFNGPIRIPSGYAPIQRIVGEIILIAMRISLSDEIAGGIIFKQQLISQGVRNFSPTPRSIILSDRDVTIIVRLANLTSDSIVDCFGDASRRINTPYLPA